MAHLHNIYDSDIHFKLDSKTRTFSNETELKLLVAQGDHNSERFTFEIPRYIEQHDMLNCNRIEIHYINISSTTRDTSKDVYYAEDLQVSPEDENIVIFSWPLRGNATKYNGSLSFSISFKCLEGDEITYSWNTLIYSKISVGKSLNNVETIAQEYSDLLEKWKKDILENINPTVTIDTELNEESDNAIANCTVAKKISQLSDSIDNLVVTGGGISYTAKTLLVNILRNAVYSTDQSTNISILESALNSSGGNEETTKYTVINNLTNVTSDNSNTIVEENSSYVANLTISENCELETVTVTMGGTDVTSIVYNDGVITIPSVTGNIVITVIANEVEMATYIQDGLLHEFTNLNASRTITGGQSIFNTENDFTVFVSAKKLDTMTNYQHNFIGAKADQLYLYRNWNGSINLTTLLEDKTYNATTCTAFTPSDLTKMQHICVVKEGTTYTTYVDNELASGTSVVNPITQNTSPLILSGDLTLNASGHNIPKMLIYNRALTQEEITQNHNSIVMEVGE